MLQITKQIGVLVTGQLGKLVLIMSPPAVQCAPSLMSVRLTAMKLCS